MPAVAQKFRDPAAWSADVEIARLKSRLSASMTLTTEIISLAQAAVAAFNDAPGPGRDLRLKTAIGMLEHLVGSGS